MDDLKDILNYTFKMYDDFKDALENQYKDYEIKFWYNGNGAGDFALENHKTFCDKALEEMPDKFTDGENFAFVKLKDGAHMYMSWLADLYNSMLVLFTIE